VASRSGPARKYYRPTAVGRLFLRNGTAGWNALTEVVGPVLAGTPPAALAKAKGV